MAWLVCGTYFLWYTLKGTGVKDGFILVQMQKKPIEKNEGISTSN